ncbi:MAG: protoporphyrinogen oxidase [Dissulfurispiraceae bacterium]|jgi:oxygen-dependent protoporphyrinogen oxidase|nr:protoporphyrinogen oxidase [Dissulfurispiraceae bacterium]
MRVIIAGAGISGLSLAFGLLQRDPKLDVAVFEGEKQAGGKIRTEKVDGYVCEAGVNGFLDNKPSTLELAKSLNLAALKSNDSSRKRYICLDGGLKRIPETPVSFFMSNFLSVGGRLRMMSEFFVPKKVYEDESLEEFGVRRVGREFFEKLLDPMASGIYAGDPSRMSIRSCFGKVYDLEQKYGGLIKGFMAIGKENKKSGKKTEAGPGGTLMSFDGGMGSLVDALCSSLGSRVKTGNAVKGIEKKGSIYSVLTEDGSWHEADCVVFACPAYDTAEIVSDMDKGIANILFETPYPPLSVAAFGYKKEKLKIDTDLFGFLVPGKEKRKLLGTLYDSSIFTNRAPEGYVMLRSMVGGARHPELGMMDADKLVATVRAELKAIAKVDPEPDFVWTYRWEKAIPQYIVGHHEKLKALDEMTAKHKNIYLAGNAYRGVSVNDSIANSMELADKIVQGSR